MTSQSWWSGHSTVDLYELPTSVGPVDTVHAGGTPQAGGRGGQPLRAVQLRSCS